MSMVVMEVTEPLVEEVVLVVMEVGGSGYTDGSVTVISSILGGSNDVESGIPNC